VTACHTLQLSGAGASGGPMGGMSSLGLALTAPVGVHLANGREPDVMSAGSPLSARAGTGSALVRDPCLLLCDFGVGQNALIMQVGLLLGAGPDEAASRRTID
jgi:hypothetical protein